MSAIPLLGSPFPMHYSSQNPVLISDKVKHGLILKCDTTGMPTYLESSHPQNRVIYEKMGFHYVKSIYLCRHIKQSTNGDTVGEDTVVQEGEHGSRGKGIELEIMVREPHVQKG
jgi:hypothetical protein